MSVKWMSSIWESDLAGGELLLALAIADHADHDGKCFPGEKTLAAKCKLSVRHIQRLQAVLEEKGYLQIVRGIGRGHMTTFQLQKVTSTTPFVETKDDAHDTLSDTEKVTSETLKGDIHDTEKVTSETSPLNKEEPLIEPLINQGEEDEEEAPTPPATFAHPALKAIRDITKSNPPREVWSPLIAVLGTDFDFARLMTCFQKWRLKSYKASNYGWITDWYANGVPEERNGTHQKPTSNSEKSGQRGINAKSMVAQLREQGLAERAAKAGQRLLGSGNGSDSP